MRLKDKIALVTGAGSGLGRTISLQMAAEGAKIGVNDINHQAINEVITEINKAGVQGLALEADVSDVTQVKEMFDKLKSSWETIDILVNCAGIAALPSWTVFIEEMNSGLIKNADELAKHGKRLESMKITSHLKDEYWHVIINIHLNGTFYCTREALKIMEERKYGKIINIASICGIMGCPGNAAYSSAKAGIIGFTKSVALEVIPSGININCVAPGHIDTPLMDIANPELKKVVTSWYPIGRMGKTEEIASMATYLATDDANFMVGQVISPNGGIVC